VSVCRAFFNALARLSRVAYTFTWNAQYFVALELPPSLQFSLPRKLYFIGGEVFGFVPALLFFMPGARSHERVIMNQCEILK
jgi:hypothetical protein